MSSTITVKRIEVIYSSFFIKILIASGAICNTFATCFCKYPDNHTTGKTVTLSPQSDHKITLLDLLPLGTGIAILNDTNLQFSLKNIGTEQRAFQVEEYGPFTNTKAPPSSTNPQALIDYMQLVIAESDYYTMNKILAEETSAHYKTVPHLFGIVSLRQIPYQAVSNPCKRSVDKDFLF